MFKILSLFLLSMVNMSNSINCYTPSDVGDLGYVSYNKKVYDISKYDHPGGKDTLLLSKGKDLELFFNIPAYSFHKNSIGTQLDLNNLYIGDIYTICDNINNDTNNSINNTGNNNTGNNQISYKDGNILLNNPEIFFSILTVIFFIFITTLIILFTNINKKFYFSKLFNFLDIKYIKFGTFIVCIFYLIWWLSLLVLSLLSKNVLTSLGIWISLNIAFTLLPITRNSIWVKFNIPYSELNFIHEFIATLTLLSVIIKIAVSIILYNFYFLFSRINLVMGTLCSIFIILLSTFAIPIIRRNFFELFYYSHRILIFFIIITMSLHYISSIYYIIPSLILYLVDLILRLTSINASIYNKIITYNLKKDNSYYIFLKIKLKNTLKIEPGSYFLICCKNTSRFQWHPLSIISNNNNTLVFCVKDMGSNSWSNRLQNLKNNIQNEIILQGPYLHFKLNYNYKYILCISNGIGITPFFTILKELNKYENTKTTLLWIIPSHNNISPFEDYFKDLNCNKDIYITKNNDNDIQEERYSNIFNLYFKRPSILKYIRTYLLKNKIFNKKEVCIYACGSYSLLKDTINASNDQNIDIYIENF